MWSMSESHKCANGCISMNSNNSALRLYLLSAFIIWCIYSLVFGLNVRFGKTIDRRMRQGLFVVGPYRPIVGIYASRFYDPCTAVAVVRFGRARRRIVVVVGRRCGRRVARIRQLRRSSRVLAVRRTRAVHQSAERSVFGRLLF